MKSKTSQFSRQLAYLIGIKGVGMTALAQVLKARGWYVEGSDTHETFFTDAVLKRHGIKVHEGFDKKHIVALCHPRPNRGSRLEKKSWIPASAGMTTKGNPILLITSSAYGDTNPEIREAKRIGLRVHVYAEILGQFFNNRDGIAVCGSHGKTTTASLAGWVFKKAGLDPTVVVGSEVPQFNGNALMGSSRHFIAEVDEYQNKFKYFKPKAMLLTNIDYDHPDFFKTRVAYRNAFRQFIARLPKDGLLIACRDDAETVRVIATAPCPTVLYGMESVSPKLLASLPNLASSLEARSIRTCKGRWHFDAYKNGKKFAAFALRLPGRHNVQNALGVIGLAHAYGVSTRTLQQALASFYGTRRRFERVGTYRGATLIDDYAHHPTEIRATLAAARELYPRKHIIAVFHPHTYSRTQALLREFAQSFGNADEVIVLDVYSSAREKIGSVGSKELVREISKRHAHVRYIPTISRAVAYLKNRLGKNDILITLGAGDVWKVAKILTK